MMQSWQTDVFHSKGVFWILAVLFLFLIPFDFKTAENALEVVYHFSRADDDIKKLKLTPRCSPDPSQYRVWRVHNENDFEVAFHWHVHNTHHFGEDVVPANGQLDFTTITVDGANTTGVFVGDDEHDSKDSSGEACNPSPTPEPPTPIPPTEPPTDIPVPTERLIRICHCLPDPPYEKVEMDVPESELEKYLANGDTLGPCPTVTPEPEHTEEPEPTETPTETHTDEPHETPTHTPTVTPEETEPVTATATETDTPTATDTVTPSETPTGTQPTPTDIPTATATSTATSTTTATATSTLTNTPTATLTNTPTSTATATNTPTATPTATPDGCDFRIAAGDVYGTGGLVSAINQANLDSTADVICLAAGVYTLNSVQMLETGLPLITSPIEIQGNAAALMRQTGSPEFRIFRIVAGGQLILDTLSITGGSLTGADGGAIYNAAGTLVIRDSLLITNTARNGGAIYNDNGAVTIADTDILSNSAPGASGGGILNIGLSSVFILTNSSVSDNSAVSGGGLYNSNGAVTITGSTINENNATSAAGVFNGSFGIVEITNSVMSANTSLAFGGAVAAEGASLRINNSCITNNVSPLGSGIVNLNTDTGSPPINAEQDWWGAASGPSGAGGGTGDAISGSIDFTPFLTAPLPFCPAAETALVTLSRTLGF